MSNGKPDGGQQASLQDLFDELVELGESEQSARLAGIAADQPELAERLSGLLKSDQHSSVMTAQPVIRIEGRFSDQPLSGQMTGAYTLTEEIGQGGMGTVYKAERTDGQVQQTVAVKLLRSGRLGDQGLRRFLSERQILARMEHPNITRLIDAGETVDGSPYVAMEYVEGLPLTVFCDQNQLNLAARLQLFLQVCNAVDHAHRNLVVHRDLKPSNILVNADGIPKLLDFGIAKLITQEMDAEQTAEHQRVFSPLYAAPEQISGDPITVGCDIYALGVVLYELLAGHHYLDVSDLKPMEIEQQIVHKQPVTPSFRLSQAEQLQQQKIAEARLAGNVDKLRQALRGDLDAIACKCVQKDVNDRYTSISQLVQDIEAYLNDRPVGARQARFRENLVKFWRRNRLPVSISGALGVTIIASSAMIWAKSIEADRERTRTEVIRDYLVQIFESVNPDNGLGVDATVREALDFGARTLDAQFEEEPRLKAEISTTIGKIRASMSQFEPAVADLSKSLKALQALNSNDRRAYFEVYAGLADAYAELHSLEKAREHLDLAKNYARTPEHHTELALTESAILGGENRHSEMRRLLQQAVDLHLDSLPFEERLRYDLMTALSNAISLENDWTEALAVRERILEEALTNLGERHPIIVRIKRRIADSYRLLGRIEDMDAIISEALDLALDLYGEQNLITAWTMAQKATALFGSGQPEASFNMTKRALAIQSEIYGGEHPDLSRINFNLAMQAQALPQLRPFAREHFEKSLEIGNLVWPDWHGNLGMFGVAYGFFLNEERDFQSAAEVLREAMKEIEIRKEEEEKFTHYPYGYFALAITEYALAPENEHREAIEFWLANMFERGYHVDSMLAGQIAIAEELGLTLDIPEEEASTE